MNSTSKYAIVTGASSGIGYELASEMIERKFDLLIAANEPEIHVAAGSLEAAGVSVQSVEADLATMAGVDDLIATAADRPVDVLIANAGTGFGGAYLDQDFHQIRHTIDTNITGTIYLVQQVARQMKERSSGQILITGSIAGYMPGPFNAVYNGTKAFIDSFCLAFRNELKDSGVSVTCLLPGATDTKFFERAGMLDTKIGQMKKDDPHDVAAAGIDAMLSGDAEIIPGWKNKILAALTNIIPAETVAQQHRKFNEPKSVDQTDATD
jgi:short-subunit dehydrogenase